MGARLFILGVLVALAAADVKELSREYLPPNMAVAVNREYLPPAEEPSVPQFVGVQEPTTKLTPIVEVQTPSVKIEEDVPQIPEPQHDEIENNNIELPTLNLRQGPFPGGFPGAFPGGFPGGNFPGAVPGAVPGGFPGAYPAYPGFPGQGFPGQGGFPGFGFPGQNFGYPGQGFVNPGFNGFPRPNAFPGFGNFFSEQIKEENNNSDSQAQNGDLSLRDATNSETVYDKENGGYLYNKPVKTF